MLVAVALRGRPTGRLPQVPKETEQCQAGCGIARMWATLFWSQQFCWACALLYTRHAPHQEGLILFGAVTKLMVACLLLNGYMSGVVHWPIGQAAAAWEGAFALLMLLDVRSAQMRRPRKER
mmetsp:Transcript_9136/g.28935  ORF Transcript_9136/g.28935 Transcript_9136/m.28935 type:complete len:122 (+) Transcript_9136:231-596(+)